MAVTGDPLSLALELQTAPSLSGDAVLTNHDAAAVRIWRQGNEWGDDALAFVIRRTGASDERLRRRVQVYTRNVPAPIDIPAGATHRIGFDLGHGEWEPSEVVEHLGEDGVQLAAVFQIAPTPESDQQGVWTGRVQSAFVAPN